MGLQLHQWSLTAVLAMLVILLGLLVPLQGSGAVERFRPVMIHLLKSGLDRELVERSFKGQPELQLETVASALRIREARLNYSQYLEPWALSKAQRFLREHGQLFDRAEAAYTVDRQTITAVLLIETRIGEYTGITPVLDILATLALMDRRDYQDRIWSLLSPDDRRAYGREAVDKRLARWAGRARKDLRALLTWYAGRSHELGSLKGSIMGAVGWPQFLPDNVLHYGVDGNGDGRIDLFEPDDTVFSVAKYLRSAGWRAGSLKARERAVLRYNHSRPYMQTVLRIAELLKEP